MKVFVSGYTGKMGQEVVRMVNREPDFTLVGQSRQGESLEKALAQTQPDVMVDFTHPSTVYGNILIALQAGVIPIVGTTGLTDLQLTALEPFCQNAQLPVIICPNFAIGAILMMQLSQEAAKYMPRAEIIEYHHDNKADAPSGTAIKTADMMIEADPSINEQPLAGIELIEGARGANRHNIPIHSVRLQGFIASQCVLFGDRGQTLTIRHDTFSRESFMPGVALAIRKAPHVQGVIYGLEKLMHHHSKATAFDRIL